MLSVGGLTCKPHDIFPSKKLICQNKSIAILQKVKFAEGCRDHFGQLSSTGENSVERGVNK